MFPALVQNWRQAFNHTTTATATDTNTGTAEEVSGSGRSADDGASSDIFFGFIQLSTWCFGGSPSSPYDINAIPYMREAQMAAATLPTVGWATNADKGDGCNIHPPAKQFCAHRLAAASLALRYSTSRSPSPSSAPPAPPPAKVTATATAEWRSPQYLSATAVLTSATVTVTVTLKDVSAAGLLVDASRAYSNFSLCAQQNAAVNCTAANQNCMCGWAAILLGNASSWKTVQCCTSGGKSGCPQDPRCNQ